ncbi:hypothetical protein GQ54DRAFT_225673 [Martensiomyces pterosporus]|nr:hypothetical protein GQ54DRAFT_225673 [Martensiomyces pterosporus]
MGSALPVFAQWVWRLFAFSSQSNGRSADHFFIIISPLVRTRAPNLQPACVGGSGLLWPSTAETASKEAVQLPGRHHHKCREEPGESKQGRPFSLEERGFSSLRGCILCSKQEGKKSARVRECLSGLRAMPLHHPGRRICLGRTAAPQNRTPFAWEPSESPLPSGPR